MSRSKLTNEIIQKYGKPCEVWPDVQFPDIEQIKDPVEKELLKKRMDIYSSRKEAFDKYFEGTPIKEINYKNDKLEAQSLSYAEISRWMKRCTTATDTGNIYGYAGLIPYYRIEPYIRTKAYQIDNIKSGQSGIFSEFLKNHPEIDDMIKKEYLFGGVSPVKTKGTTGAKIYDNMIRMCRKMKLDNEYPLDRYNTKNQAGKRALYDYLKKLRLSEYSLYAKYHLTEDATILASTTGAGQKNNPLPVDIFQTIEIDEHTIDGKFIITLSTYEGDTFIEEINNITLIAGVDRNSKALIGYHAVPGKSYTAEDIKRCIINCIMPHKRMTFNVPGFKYPSEVCFTSEVAPEMEWATFGQIMFDNHMTHKSAEIRDFLENKLEVHVNYGAVCHPTVRNCIEKSFDILETMTFHRLPNTTGGNKDSSLRNHPEEQAAKYQMTFNQAKQIIELGIAEYNLKSKTGNHGMSPIQTIKSRLTSGRIPKILEASKRAEITTITNKVIVNVLGDLDKGRNPYVNYQYARYTSPKLAKEKKLIGEELTLVVNVDDARYAKAYKKNGEFFDTLTANGSWGKIEHTLKLRTYLCQRRDNGELDFTDSDDFIEVYKTYLSRHEHTSVANDFICDVEEEIERSRNNKEFGKSESHEDDISINSLISTIDSKTTDMQHQNRDFIKLKESDLFDRLSKAMQYK